MAAEAAAAAPAPTATRVATDSATDPAVLLGELADVYGSDLESDAAQVAQVTGADIDTARSLLQACGGDVPQVIRHLDEAAAAEADAFMHSILRPEPHSAGGPGCPIAIGSDTFNDNDDVVLITDAAKGGRLTGTKHPYSGDAGGTKAKFLALIPGAKRIVHGTLQRSPTASRLAGRGNLLQAYEVAARSRGDQQQGALGDRAAAAAGEAVGLSAPGGGSGSVPAYYNGDYDMATPAPPLDVMLLPWHDEQDPLMAQMGLAQAQVGIPGMAAVAGMPPPAAGHATLPVPPAPPPREGPRAGHFSVDRAVDALIEQSDHPDKVPRASVLRFFQEGASTRKDALGLDLEDIVDPGSGISGLAINALQFRRFRRRVGEML
ncbi:hypothetical protein GPECTOR_2350g1241 [Gonium pectorale]|uniref:Uncharacterized protein n=1 Tax=Gonium pectorale TaxID=33097 RepID=A0A150FT64_GONPE|nr:hypothetical protein GPECTOR_2350g1241 [Gonium pectorale]|eukprot:KXZ40802.1 hypothetical protein GPECTOR_2350g1241 [Gonium pectorale]